ncbi:MAG: hypothetical protein P1S46_01120 [bacterium]|nr:hypothetical protein [bacterium]MDT8396002.1 hypothetical protein [bacterium]
MEKEFEKVKEALEDFGKKIVDAVKKGKGEADKVTRIAQVRIEVGSLGRQRKDLCLELGDLFYANLQKASAKGQADIAETVANISELDKRVAGLNRMLKAIREDKPAPGRRGRPPKAEAAKKGKAKAPTAKSETPKRRGRPPKAASAKSEAPKRRGRPPRKAAAKAASSKRRGRPSKSASAPKAAPKAATDTPKDAR